MIPHFDLPFRLSGSSFAVANQDSQEDIANCVEAILRTPLGARDDITEFGLTDHVFELMPLNLEEMTAQIETQEPRASVDIVQRVIDLTDNLTVQVNK